MGERCIKENISLPNFQRKGLTLLGGVFKDMLRKLREETGATAVEYAMMIAFIAAVIVTAATLLGSSVNDVFTAYLAML
jgi:Flp pilus assembly pilin Flp